jgi:hypothetical protein
MKAQEAKELADNRRKLQQQISSSMSDAFALIRKTAEQGEYQVSLFARWEGLPKLIEAAVCKELLKLGYAFYNVSPEELESMNCSHAMCSWRSPPEVPSDERTTGDANGCN